MDYCQSNQETTFYLFKEIHSYTQGRCFYFAQVSGQGLKLTDYLAREHLDTETGQFYCQSHIAERLQK